MNRLNVPVSMKCKTDKPERHKDGSGHHHPMGVFPIEEQMQHLAIAPSLVISPTPSGRLELVPVYVLTPLAFPLAGDRRNCPSHTTRAFHPVPVYRCCSP